MRKICLLLYLTTCTTGYSYVSTHKSLHLSRRPEHGTSAIRRFATTQQDRGSFSSGRYQAVLCLGSPVTCCRQIGGRINVHASRVRILQFSVLALSARSSQRHVGTRLGAALHQIAFNFSNICDCELLTSRNVSFSGDAQPVSFAS